MSETKEKSTSVETLREKLKKKTDEVVKLRWRIEEIELKEELPQLKKKYEGKYFKYRNSVSNDNQWWLYSRCKEVKNKYRFIFDTFEVTPYACEFKISDECGDHLCQTEITKNEYEREAKKFIKIANKIL